MDEEIDQFCLSLSDHASLGLGLLMAGEADMNGLHQMENQTATS